ncbi:hypothetical protein CBR_g40480 [Chara braunii]|uniref:Uncharacterized protein n=1 Tax=Chara braunii TaxID=69332 RepID=A0A388LU04_CHABU|nr:hypothetical protein CBR_g40480 [Chara braunii]|eukprot:GBG85751.1 hypothetical protein CBR_g40480 [Chara braunii]
MKVVCESVLGKKGEIPDDDESEVSKLRQEIDDLKTKCAGDKKDSTLDVLCKEKETLQMAQNRCSEEDALRREIEELKLRNEKRKPGEKSDEVAALQLQLQELEKICVALDKRSSELSTLQSENSHLEKDVLDLKGVVEDIKGSGKRLTGEVTTRVHHESTNRTCEGSDIIGSLATQIVQPLRNFFGISMSLTISLSSLTGCLTTGAHVSNTEKVIRESKRLFDGLVLVPLDHNTGDTYACCPLIYAGGVRKLFTDNPGLQKLSEDEDAILQRCKEDYKALKLQRLALWVASGKLGRSYVIRETQGRQQVAPYLPILE